MSDLIDNALSTLNGAGVNVPNVPQVPELPTDAIDKLSSIETDPELIQRRLEAEYLKKKAEFDEQKILIKEQGLQAAKDALAAFVIASIPFPPKLPMINPKILQALALANQFKNLYKERQKVSKQNIKDGARKFSHPITKLPKQSKISETIQNQIPENIPIDVPDLPLINR